MNPDLEFIRGFAARLRLDAVRLRNAAWTQQDDNATKAQHYREIADLCVKKSEECERYVEERMGK